MKTHAYLIAIVCFFIMSGCQKDNPLAGLPADAVLLATEGFSNPDGTKTQVSQNHVLWTDGDPVNLDGNPYITPTDIATFLLYGHDLYALKTFSLYSPDMKCYFTFNTETATIVMVDDIEDMK